MSQLKVNSIIPVAGVPTGGGGGIIQIKQAVKTDQFTSTASSPTDITGLSLSMAVSNASHKVLIHYNVAVGGDWWNTGPAFLTLLDDSTIIGTSTAGSEANHRGSTFSNHYSNSQSNSGYNTSTHSMSFLHSPTNTNSHTYKIQGHADNTNTGQGWAINRVWETNNYGAISTLTVMEVSA